MKKIKLAVVDDEVLFRKGLIFLLKNEPNFSVIFEGGDGIELKDYLKAGKTQPDIVLLDIQMPVLNGIETAKLLTKDFPNIKIIIISTFESELLIEQMIHFGASSYLVKNADPKDMVHTINRVHESGVHLPPKLQSILKRKSIVTDSDNFGLTEREIEILDLTYKQYSSTEIAQKLYISERTVETHRQKLLKKTNSKNVVGLILFGIRHNLISAI